MKPFAAGVCVVLCALAALAQTKPLAKTKAPVPAKETRAEAKPEPKTEAKPVAEAEVTAAQQRGLSLLREAAREAAAFDNKRQAARVLAQAGDLLWKHDQTGARELFEQAFETAINYYRDSKDDNTERLTRSSVVNRPDVRLEVMRLAGRHDAALGKRLTDRYVTEKKREVEERLAGEQNANAPTAEARRGLERMFGPQDPAANDLLSAARTLSESDPKTAFQLVQRAFANSVPAGAPAYLPQMAARDRKATDEIYVAALTRLTLHPQPHAGELLLLSAYPFGEDRVWVANGESTNSYGFGVPQGYSPDPQIIGRFLATAASVLAKAAQLNPAQYPEQLVRVSTALFAARLLEPKVAQYQPELQEEWGVLTQRLLALSADATRKGIDQTLGEIARDKNEHQPGGLPPDRTKDLTDRAEKTTNLAERDDLYMQAALQALRQGELDKAFTLADKISDLGYRRNVRSWINFDAAGKALSEKRLDDARRLALEVDATDQRAYLFFQIAGVALKEQQRAQAIELLEEAARYALVADNTPEKVRALLGITNQYAPLDQTRAFELATEAAKTINKLGDYNPDQAQLVRTLALRGGRGANTNVNSVEGFDLGRTLTTLARSDFERALLLAQSLEQKPIKYTTVLTLATLLFNEKSLVSGQ
jgi:tetratricopeptide (TPR) repeat protein